MSRFAVPGLRFVADLPRPDAGLPRMDIAGFVGLAASGPVGIPVAVEDEVAFTEIFGGDLALAWDADAGRMQTAHLAGSVRAFFRGGGRRCWVVRVTGPGAATQRFPLLGMLARETGGTWRGATIGARSPGSWADRLAVRTRLRSLAVSVFARGADTLTVADLGDWQVGDLLRLNHADGVAQYLRVRGVATPAQAPRRRVLTVDAVLAVQAWAVSPGDAVTLRLNTAEGGFKKPVAQIVDGALELDLDGTPAPQPGEILVGRRNGAELAFQVDRVGREDAPGTTRIRVAAAWQLGVAAPALDDPQHAPSSAERLRLDLAGLAEQGDRALTELGFDPAHARAWSRLPDDAALYELPDTTRPRALDAATAAFHAELAPPRFPLAYVAKPLAAAIPLGMPTHTAGFDDVWRGTASDALDAVAVAVRDGLAGYGVDDLLDPRLVAHDVGALPAEAFHWRYQRDTALRGLHALYFVSEISLIAVPDAAQPVWGEVSPDADDGELPAAVLQEPKRIDAGLALAWTPKAPTPADVTLRWRVQIAVTPDFAGVADEFDTADLAAVRALPPVCARRLWLRVRAEVGDRVDGRIGVWSNTVHAQVAESGFARRDDPLPIAPELTVYAADATSCPITWTHSGAPGYQLEEADRPDFADAETLYRGADSGFMLRRPNRERRYYRVRAWYGDAVDPVGPWSETALRTPPLANRWRVTAPVPAGTLADIHRAMLVMAAARADLCVLLSLPEGMEYADVEAHRAALVASLAAIPRTASYGLMYHPWPFVVAADGARALPPDGPVLAEFARRALADGAWIAPANRPLVESLGLSAPAEQGGRAAEDRHWAALYARGVNLLRARPEGITVLSAETLSEDDELRPANVRRLLILLRRLALREGDELVFEPNDASFRRRVQSRFEALLDGLFERGAFQGARPEQAFQIVVDDSVNPAQAVDEGRFVVELRVAPSRPLAFLTVRLVQNGAEGLAVEGT